MTRDEYNQKLQQVQEIEAQTGLNILRRWEHHDTKTGRMTSAGFTGNRGTVFRQTDPFTGHATYWIDEALWRGIVYRDPSR